jgi:hypothetical protein
VVLVELGADGTDPSVAVALGQWATTWPGEQAFYIDINDKIAGWPTGVNGSIEALAALGCLIEEHSTSFKVELRDADGNGVYGVSKEDPRAWLGLRRGFNRTLWERRYSGFTVLAVAFSIRLVSDLLNHFAW